MKRLKRIEQKIDAIIERINRIEVQLILKNENPKHEMRFGTSGNPPPLKTNREKAQQAANDYYWNPTKFPPVEDSDTVISETNPHFE